MEAKIVPLSPLPVPSSLPSVRVDGDRIVLERIVLADHDLASFVADRPLDDRPALVERALKIGLTALQDVGVTVNVDVVRAEFEKLVGQTQALNQRAADTLEQVLRANFADGDGRLPRTLERFLGDRGSLQAFVNDLFDPGKRDSAIGRMQALLGTYFDGDASRLAQLLDPTRFGSPLHQFRTEVADGFKAINDKLVALEAATTARAGERAKSAAKGADFESLLDAMLGDLARGAGDAFERTGDLAGDALRSKKGDFVLTVNPDLTRGAELRIVIEAKDKYVSGRDMAAELREAKTNRNAAVGLVVFTPAHAPTGIAPFDIRVGDVYCVVDPAAPDPANLEAAVRLARLYALATLREREVEVDAEAIRTALEGIRAQLGLVQGMKSTLTSIGNSSRDVAAKLDQVRDGILSRLAEAEAELRAAR
ncbi:MAG TPA: hypothetical protein VF802_02405 [Candidatus Limnocylindrales bacterium]